MNPFTFSCNDWLLLVQGCSFFFNDTPPNEIYTLSLHDALPISGDRSWLTWGQEHHASRKVSGARPPTQRRQETLRALVLAPRSEEHTSELQSHSELVCRLLLEKKKRIARLEPDPRFCQTLLESR